MTISEKIDLSISKEIIKNTTREMLALFFPPLAAFYNKKTDLGSYLSKLKIERQNYCIQNLLSLIQDKKTEE